MPGPQPPLLLLYYDRVAADAGRSPHCGTSLHNYRPKCLHLCQRKTIACPMEFTYDTLMYLPVAKILVFYSNSIHSIFALSKITQKGKELRSNRADLFMNLSNHI